MTDGLGKTTGQGKNDVSMIAQAMDLSGNTLPQVSAQGGSLSGVFHVVTTDGAGPIEAVVDPTATGQFSQGIKLKATTQVPGNNGNIRPNGKVPRDSIFSRTVERVRRGLGIEKRAANVNQDFVSFPFWLPNRKLTRACSPWLSPSPTAPRAPAP
jgi:Egh16-like virulence factor